MNSVDARIPVDATMLTGTSLSIYYLSMTDIDTDGAESPGHLALPLAGIVTLAMGFGSLVLNAAPRCPVTLSHRIRVAAAAGVFISVGSLAACATSARFETTGGGHPIFATVTGPHTIESRATHATIATQSGIVTVERTRARIADLPWETIPEHVPVRVMMSKHAASIRAGAVTISRTMR